jgi:hypothetical protein
MATKSNRSSGSQINQRGVAQGNTLVDPVTGNPVSVITDNTGKKRLAVDANVSLDNVTVNVDLNSTDDQVAVEDPNTGAHIRVETNGSINANVEVSAADGDSVAISDGTDTLAINADGSINVNVTSGSAETVKIFYNEVTAVASSTLTTIITFTAAGGVTTYLQKIEVSGTNIAQYTVEINSVVKDKKRTYFGNSLNEQFVYSINSKGLPLAVGDVVTARVVHLRPNVGDFNSRIQIVEV